MAPDRPRRPAEPEALRLSAIEPLHLVSVRVMPGADTGWTQTLGTNAPARLPLPGRFDGDAVRWVWRSPTEYWAVTAHAAHRQALLLALGPGSRPDACAVDHSAGTLGFALEGHRLDDVLARLMDAAAIPAEPGRAVRARCVDLAVVMLRIDSRQAWLLVERPVAAHLLAGLRSACERAGG